MHGAGDIQDGENTLAQGKSENLTDGAKSGLCTIHQKRHPDLRAMPAFNALYIALGKVDEFLSNDV